MFTPASVRSASLYKTASVEASVAGADRHGLVTLLLEELLRCLRTARASMETADIAVKCGAIAKSIRILEDGLIISLNMDEGGALAQNLNALYRHCVVRLVHANASNDLSAVDEVRDLITPILDAWKQIGAQAQGQMMAA